MRRRPYGHLYRFHRPRISRIFRLTRPQYKRLIQLWNWNLIGDTLTAITGDPWNVLNDFNRYFYFNPRHDGPIPPNATVVSLFSGWRFPIACCGTFRRAARRAIRSSFRLQEILELGRYRQDLGKSGFRQRFSRRADGPAGLPGDQLELADKSAWQTFGPPGPRGWQDEYCEWSVTRDPASNKITSVMFTCENPDYWFTLWQVDPASGAGDLPAGDQLPASSLPISTCSTRDGKPGRQSADRTAGLQSAE